MDRNMTNTMNSFYSKMTAQNNDTFKLKPIIANTEAESKLTSYNETVTKFDELQKQSSLPMQD